MTNKVKHTGAPLSFNYIYNFIHAYKNGVPYDKEQAQKALEGNKQIHDQHAELLDQLEMCLTVVYEFRKYLAERNITDAAIDQRIRRTKNAIVKAKNQP